MKKRIVVKLSGQVFSMDETKKLKDYATFFVKKSKTHQPIIVLEVERSRDILSPMLDHQELTNPL